jgi:hypothetical protein
VTTARSCGPGWKNGSAGGRTKEWYQTGEQNALRRDTLIPCPQPSTKPGQVQSRFTEMGRQVAVVLYVAAMAAVIVGVDFLFFKHRFWERLIVNIGIVLVFAAFYLKFLRRP